MSELRTQVMDQIVRALREELSVEEATEFLTRLDKSEDPVIAEAAHAAVHFVTDADLRSDDQAHDALLRATLLQYVEQLKHA